MSNLPTITLDKVPEILRHAGEDPVLLLGASGIGKTESVVSFAKQHGRVLYINMGAIEPGFATGAYLPYKSSKGVVLKRLVDDMYPVDDYSTPTTIVLDEITLSLEGIPDILSLVQGMVGDQTLAKGTRIVAMGNEIEDNPMCHELPPPVMSRFASFKVSRKPSDILKGYLPWARKNDISHELLAYLNHNTDNIFTFGDANAGNLYNCPRSLTKADKYIKSKSWLMVASLLGTVEASKIEAFTKHFKDVISYKDIVNGSADSIESAPILYITIETLIVYFDEDDVYAILKWMGKLTPDFAHIVETALLDANKLDFGSVAYIEYSNGV